MVKDLGEVKLCKRYCVLVGVLSRTVGSLNSLYCKIVLFLRMFVEFGQGPWGGKALQKKMCVSGSFVKDSGESKLFVL